MPYVTEAHGDAPSGVSQSKQHESVGKGSATLISAAPGLEPSSGRKSDGALNGPAAAAAAAAAASGARRLGNGGATPPERAVSSSAVNFSPSLSAAVEGSAMAERGAARYAAWRRQGDPTRERSNLHSRAKKSRRHARPPLAAPRKRQQQGKVCGVTHGKKRRATDKIADFALRAIGNRSVSGVRREYNSWWLHVHVHVGTCIELDYSPRTEMLPVCSP